MLPEQLNPSPEYPSIQVQVWFASVLLQLACGLQPPLFTAHSSATVLYHNVVVNIGFELYLSSCDNAKKKRKIYKKNPFNARSHTHTYAFVGPHVWSKRRATKR